MPIPRIVAIAIIVMLAVFAAGCGSDGDTVQVRSTVVERTVTVTSTQTVTAPSTFVVPASTDRAFFRTPTGNILCYMGNDEVSGPAVRCLLREASWPSPPPRPAECEFDWNDSVIGISDGAVDLGACLSDFPWGCVGSEPCDAVLPWDGSIVLGDRIRCTARRTGLECRDGSGEGFVASRESYRIIA